MPIPAQTPEIDYTGNGAATSYAYPFRIFAAADLVVSVAGVVKTLNVDYTVSGVNSPSGGSVVFAVAPANGAAVNLLRSTPIDRLTDYTTAGPNRAETLDDDLDRAAAQRQDMNHRLTQAETDIDSLEARMDTAEADIDTNAAAIAQEIADRQAAVASEATSREAADDAEATARAAGDTALQNQITTNTNTLARALRFPEGDTTSPLLPPVEVRRNTLAGYGPGGEPTANAATFLPLTGGDVSVGSIAALRAVPVVADSTVVVQGYYVAGDGGGAPIRIGKSGAAPGTYVDNGGSVIVPNGGDGSAAWVWEWPGAVNIKWFGAKGDGVFDCYQAISKAIEAEKNLSAPEGVFYSSQAIKLPHTISYFREDTGHRIEGAGICTVFTRNSVNGVASATDATAANSAFFLVPGSNNVFENFRVNNSDVGIYFGQDPAIDPGTAQSHTSFNRLKNLWIEQCGTGILSAVSLGHYYNDYDSLHIYECQIGVHFRRGAWGSAVPNNNRNTFKNIRSSRCYVGLWIENGDTNTIYSFHCEKNKNPTTNNGRTFPSGLPAQVTGGIAHIFGSETQKNKVFGSTHEDCDFYLYNAGDDNEFYGNYYREGISTDVAKSIFVTQPLVFVSGDTFKNKVQTFIINPNSLGLAVPSGQLRLHYPTIFEYDYRLMTNNAYTKNRLVHAGAVASGGSVNVTIQADAGDLASSSSILTLIIVGNSQTNSLAFYKRARVLCLRNSSRTITRHYLFDEGNARATGAGAGDTSEPFFVSPLVSGKDLVVELTAPARTFESVTVLVEEHVSR